MNKSPLAFWPFAGKALACLVFGFIASRRLMEQAFGLIVFSVFIFAFPVALSGAYSSTVNQVRRLSYFKESGWAHSILSRRFFSTFLWLIVSLLTSFFLLLQFSTYSTLEWLALAISIPVFWVTYFLSHRFLFSELKKPYVIMNFTIGWARWICPIVMTALYLGLAWIVGNTQSYGSLTEALAARRVGMIEGGGSAVVEVVLRLITFADGSKAYLASRFKEHGQLIPFVLMAVGAFVVFFNATATFSCIAIGSTEYRRVFGPLTEVDVPPPLRRGRIALISALVTFVTLVVYLPLFAEVEDAMRKHPEVIATIKTMERKVEQIDKDYYNPGTIERIQTAKAVLLGRIDVSKATLDGQVNRAFTLMEGNVDGYLDWYYSLSAEYMRLGKLLLGDIEGYMEAKLSEYLQKGDPSGEIERGIKATLSTHQAAMDDFQLTVKGILDSNRISADGAKLSVMSYVSLNDMLSMPIHADLVSLNTRVAGGAAAAGVAGVVTGKIVSKVVFKAAAKAVAKAAAAKVGGTATGAVIGAAIGGVVPFAGPIIGGVIGGVIGGIATDAALLKLDEAINRKDFRMEILASIQQAQAEFKAKLWPEH